LANSLMSKLNVIIYIRSRWRNRPNIHDSIIY
jgi:hypothetical protein